MNFNEELKKSHDDFSYFCEKFIKIEHPLKGLIPFKLYPFQERLIQEYEDNRFVIATKFRQGGFSTLNVIYALWKCLFHCDERILFVTKTDWEARGLNRLFRRAFQFLPDEWKDAWEVGSCNDHEVEFKATNSRVWFFTPQACCSRSMTYLFLDEPAFIPDMDMHWKAMYPTLSCGGKCFAISTVNGTGNWFHEVYTKAVAKENQFKVFECSYKEHPALTPEKIEVIKQNLGAKSFAQEMECNFFVGRHPNGPVGPVGPTGPVGPVGITGCTGSYTKRGPKQIRREILNLVVELLEYYDDTEGSSATTEK